MDLFPTANTVVETTQNLLGTNAPFSNSIYMREKNCELTPTTKEKATLLFCEYAMQLANVPPTVFPCSRSIALLSNYYVSG